MNSALHWGRPEATSATERAVHDAGRKRNRESRSSAGERRTARPPRPCSAGVKLAVRPGFEPGLKAPKARVLPLHHRTSGAQPSLARLDCKAKTDHPPAANPAPRRTSTGGATRLLTPAFGGGKAARHLASELQSGTMAVQQSPNLALNFSRRPLAADGVGSSAKVVDPLPLIRVTGAPWSRRNS